MQQLQNILIPEKIHNFLKFGTRDKTINSSDCLWVLLDIDKATR